MATKRAKTPKIKPSLRSTVSFPAELYHTLEQMAMQKKVSVAWIVRDAAEKYVADQWPLLEKRS